MNEIKYENARLKALLQAKEREIEELRKRIQSLESRIKE